MIADEVINEARDHHGSFDPQRTPPRVALRALSRLARRLAEKVTAMSEDALAEPIEIDRDTLLAAVVGRTGIALPAHLLVVGDLYTWRSDRAGLEEVEMVDYSGRFQKGLEQFPAVVLKGGMLYPVNLQDAPLACLTTRHGWEDYQGIKLDLVPLPADMETLEDAVGLPDLAKDSLVLSLALFMAGRSGAGVVKDLPLLASMAQDAEAAAVNTLASMDTTTRWTVTRRRD